MKAQRAVHVHTAHDVSAHRSCQLEICTMWLGLCTRTCCRGPRSPPSVQTTAGLSSPAAVLMETTAEPLEEVNAADVMWSSAGASNAVKATSVQCVVRV